MELKVEPEEGGEVYGRWESTREDIACPAHRQDVYERSLVVVGQSGVAGGGEGLFAREEIPANTVCSYYNGVRMGPGEESVEEDSGYAIFLRQRAHKGRVPLIHVRYAPFFCVYCVPYNWSQVHKYTNIMDYVEM